MAVDNNKDLSKYWEKTVKDVETAPKYNFLELQRELYHTCKLQGYATSEIQAFSSKCFELAPNINEEENKALLNKIGQKIWFNLLNSLEVVEFLDSTKLTPKQKSLISLYVYLNMVEGASSVYVQFIALMLIKNGSKLYDHYNKRIAQTYEDLERINLSSKLKFLVENGLGFAVKQIDRNLRNCIAHQDFIIFNDGSVKNLKTGEPIDIETKLHSLCLTSSLTSLVLKQTFDIISPSTDKSLTA